MKDRELIMSFRRDAFRVDWFSGQGAGGQHRNKHQNCCRITHVETGLVATGQNHRERSKNQNEAFRTLAERLIDFYGLGPSKKERISHSNVVRAYHFERNVVSDGAVQKEVKAVMNGVIDEFVEQALTNGRTTRKTAR